MGKHRNLEDLRDHAVTMANRYVGLMERGDTDQKRARAMDLFRRWNSKATEYNARLRNLHVLEARAAKSTRAQHLAPTLKDNKAVEQRRKALSQAGVEWDHRSATGARTYDVVSMGAKSRAFVNHVNACIRKRQDRRPERILAWEALDEHFHAVHSGNLPGSKFEVSSRNSRPPSIAEYRLDAQAEDRDLRKFLGLSMHGLLYQVIYEHRSLTEVSERTSTDVTFLGEMLLVGLDLAASRWNLGGGGETRIRRWSNLPCA